MVEIQIQMTSLLTGRHWSCTPSPPAGWQRPAGRSRRWWGGGRPRRASPPGTCPGSPGSASGRWPSSHPPPPRTWAEGAENIVLSLNWWSDLENVLQSSPRCFCRECRYRRKAVGQLKLFVPGVRDKVEISEGCQHRTCSPGSTGWLGWNKKKSYFNFQVANCSEKKLERVNLEVIWTLRLLLVWITS